ncbi:ATP-binding cassette domain-containing protein [Rhodobacteraceae bacterium HSP-20]|uniref:ATP-binding cassette domain-containing protein n=1 Tax=Paragemmobacter amnigenus TaxID=2852097 RepID=A0ABS6J2F9_9RHOB|nr:ATP-binding cassette domain-containing protein [Rhodobacter amnigenus]MBU9697941.1 ATP-binding cassette domain-containing protein [Rhodobacter amnigenus]MBV4389168.1 ATP-binding cassette domain-containing protein [Rhodobacter amnigenus]
MHPARAAQTAVAVTPAQPPQPPAPLRARAETAAVLSARLGGRLLASDIVDLLVQTGAPERPGLDHIAAAFRRAGYSVSLDQDAALDGLPALAEMQTGQIVLVLSRDGDLVTIYDPTVPDRMAEVPLSDFAAHHTGWILRVRLPFAEVETRHAEPGKRPHWFWSEFRNHRRAMAEVAVASLVTNLLATAIAFYSMQIYDRVIPNQSEPTLWVLTLGALLAIALDGALRVARAALMDTSGRKIELSVQDRLMQRLLGMRAAPGDRRPSQIFGAMREFGSVREFFTASTIGTLTDLPFLVIFLALVAMVGGNLVWVLVLGGLLMVVPGFLLQSRMVALTQATQGANMRAAKLLYEAVFEHETLTTQRGQDRVRRLWSELVTLSALRASDQRHLTTMLTSWANAVQQATYVATILIGTYLVFAGSFTVGTIIAVSMLASRTLAPLAQLSALLARWSNVKSALTGLEAIAEAKQTEDPARRYLRRDRLTGSFELREVTFRYSPDAAPTVDVAALAVPAGQHVAILGANGSGKSTFLRLLAGLYDPDHGRILLDGSDMGQIHPRDLRRHVGYLGQEVRLIEGSLRDNLTMTDLERDDDRLLAALDFAGLGPFVRNHPRGLDLELRETGEGLSVGQRQSVGWARLWLQDPKVVLLDEPTAALDQTLEATLVSRLGHWLQGRTALIATHRIPILHLTTRTLILQGGRLAVDGPRDAVLAHLAKAAT